MLQFDHISKQYLQAKVATPALRDISAVIPAGQVIALCGPSGSGKSTLLNIAGLIDCQYEGTLYFQGERMPKQPASLTRLRREQLGFIFQRYNLVEVMTAFENVEYPLLLARFNTSRRRDMVMEILHAVGLAGHEHQRPNELSGGQQQRVAIARALVRQPALVIADEPTANLDSVTAAMVIDLMRRLGHQHQTTFLIATHDERMMSRCDSALHLLDGQLQSMEPVLPVQAMPDMATQYGAQVKAEMGNLACKV